MKTCPSCHRIYEDETLVFCLQDGARLMSDMTVADPNATWNLPQPITPKGSPGNQVPRMTVPSPQATITARPGQFQINQPGSSSPDHSSGQTARSSSLPWVLAIVLVIGASGVLIAWIMTRTPASGEVVSRSASPERSPAVASPTTDEPAKPTFEVMNNISFDGSRITYYPRSSFEECQSDCAKNSNCKGFTWIRPGAYNPGDSAMCYLMASVTGRATHTCCISAVRN